MLNLRVPGQVTGIIRLMNSDNAKNAENLTLYIPVHISLLSLHGGPNVVLKRPNLRTLVKARGDGNCLFRCFSYILTGSQDQHFAVRMAIVAHMLNIAPLLESCHNVNVL